MKTRFLVVDTETGGLEPQKDALLSVALIDSLTNESLYLEIRAEPGLAINEFALQVNGFTIEECISEKRISEIDAIGHIRKFIMEHSPAIIAGCNVKFDMDFLIACCNRHNIEPPFSHRSFDLQSLSLVANELELIRLAEKNGAPSISLNTILSALNLVRSGDSHNALEDAKLTLNAIKTIFQLLSQKI